MTQGPKPALPEASIRRALTSVLGSSGFRRSERMTRFLRYVVDCSLAGEGYLIKETSIGVAVFDRAPGYDPKLDPVVRNEARRLRSKLDQYYDGEGASDPVRIKIPKGSYLPHFEGIAPPAAQRPRIRPWVAAAAAGAMVLVLFLTFGRWGSAPPAVIRTRIAPLTSHPAREIHPAFAPDGRRIAFSWDRDGSFDLYTLDLTGQPERRTNTSANELRPAWSPDGRRIAFLRAQGDGFDVCVMPADGKGERHVGRIEYLAFGRPLENVLQMHGHPGPVWSRDGKDLIVTQGEPGQFGRPLHVISIEGGSRRRLTHPATAYDFYPSVSPDGRLVAFSRWISNSTSQLFVVPFAGGAEKRVLEERADLRGIAWSQDQHSLIVSSNRAGPYQLWRIPLESGRPELVPTTGLTAIEPSIAPDGQSLVYTDFALESELWSAPMAAGGRARPLVASTRQNHSAQYSPDGRRIAFVSNSSGFWEIWGANADGSSPVQLTHFEGPLLGSVRWSPDGRTLTFDARPDGHSAIYLMAADGSNLRRAHSGTSEEKMPNFSTDGRGLYFNSNRDGIQRLWRQDLTTGDTRRVTSHFAMDSREDAAGQRVYFQSDGAGLWQVRPDGAEESPVAGLEAVPFRRLWEVNRQGLWYLGADRNTVFLYDLLTHRARPVLQLEDPELDTPSLSVSPDGSSIVHSRQRAARSDLMLLRGL